MATQRTTKRPDKTYTNNSTNAVLDDNGIDLPEDSTAGISEDVSRTDFENQKDIGLNPVMSTDGVAKAF